MPGFTYTTDVAKGSVNMRWLTDHLNMMSYQGWRLHTLFEQDKNTVMDATREAGLAPLRYSPWAAHRYAGLGAPSAVNRPGIPGGSDS
jgi:hypothetical protein